jgi:hypothetical protein
MSSGTDINVELRIMPSGDGCWYWEVVKDGRIVIKRGVADTQPGACQDANAAAQDAKLIPSSEAMWTDRADRDASGRCC